MKLIMIRHGATEWSVTGQHTGRTDIPLTVEGLAEATESVAGVRRLLGDDFEAAVVFSSPLQRALVTAETIFAGRPITVDPDLAEFDYGAYEGLTSPQIRERDASWSLWATGCPGGETCADVGKRADRFLARAEAAGSVVVAVAHGHCLRILAMRAVGLAPELGAILTLDTATVSVIEDVRGKRVIRRWNLNPRE